MEIFNCWFELNLSTRYFWFSIWKLSSFSFLSGAIDAVWMNMKTRCKLFRTIPFGVSVESESLGFCFSIRMGQSGDSLLYFSSIILAKCFFCKTVHVQRCVLHMQYTSHLHQIYIIYSKQFDTCFVHHFCQKINLTQLKKMSIRGKKQLWTPQIPTKNNITRKSY